MWSLLCLVLGIVILILLGNLLSFQNSLQEITEGLDEKLHTDTNTLISVSSGNRKIRLFAEQINRQLWELRREQLNLNHGNQELKVAVTNISHDLRTPLTAICGYLELLEQEESGDNVKKYLDVIKERTDSMRSLTEELFSCSLLAIQDEKLHIEQICINDILEQSIAGFYGVLINKRILPDIQMSEIRVMKQLDKEAVRRIFDNILSNAARYSDGDLAISLSADGRIQFSNHAAKLSSVEVEKLFERFYTVETARNSTGIGLSIARLLTERMGGDITAEYKDGQLYIQIAF